MEHRTITRSLAVILILSALLISGCGQVGYNNIHQEINIVQDLSGQVSQTFTLNPNNYSLIANQYAGDPLEGHAYDLAQAMGWSEYDVETWNDADFYYIKMTATFANAEELKFLLANSGQELDLRETDGIFSKKYGFVSTARIGQLNADSLTVSLKLPGSIALSNGSSTDDGIIEWNLSQDSRLMAISGSLIEYDAFVQLSFNTDTSGKLIVGVVAPEENIRNAGNFHGGGDSVESVGNFVIGQTHLDDAAVSGEQADGLTWVYITKAFDDPDEAMEIVKYLGLFKSLDFERTGDNFNLSYALTAELYPYPKGLANPNHLSVSVHLPGEVTYSNGARSEQTNLVWDVSDVNGISISATSSSVNVQSIRKMSLLGIGIPALLLGLIGLAILLIARRTPRPRLRTASLGLLGLAVIGGIALAGVLFFFSETTSRSLVYLPTPGPAVEYGNLASLQAGNGSASQCNDGYADSTGLCWNSLDSVSGAYDPGMYDTNGNGYVDSDDTYDYSLPTPEPYDSYSSQDSYDPFDYDSDGVGNMFDNDPNYYNPPGDFDYGQQDPPPYP